jgi:1,4-alpha-glucan branching enzyme
MNTEKWDEHRLTTWFDTFLPTLDLEKQEVTDFMVDSAIYWITEYNFDGFRHDATKHIPNNFWRTLNKKVKQVSQEKGKYIYQIGETYGSHELINSYIGSG